MINRNFVSQDEARKLSYCPACGCDKSAGSIVCWQCFKGIDDSLKYTAKPWYVWLSQRQAHNGITDMDLTWNPQA